MYTFRRQNALICSSHFYENIYLKMLHTPWLKILNPPEPKSEFHVVPRVQT